jgi:hypothetical protein
MLNLEVVMSTDWPYTAVPTTNFIFDTNNLFPVGFSSLIHMCCLLAPLQRHRKLINLILRVIFNDENDKLIEDG